MKQNNAVKRVVKVIGECCLKLFEKYTDYINNQAYSYVAITGKGFYSSSWDGFIINTKHAAKFRHASFLARVFIITIKLGLCLFNGITLYILMVCLDDIEEVQSPYGPILVVSIFTWICASMFLGMFDGTVEAILTSWSVDWDLHEGNTKWGPPQIHRMIKQLFYIMGVEINNDATNLNDSENESYGYSENSNYHEDQQSNPYLRRP